MSVVTARVDAGVVPMHRCVGQCGALVRDKGYCVRCEERQVELEGKWLAAERKRRQNAPQVCEASDFACILVDVPVRERLIMAGIVIGSLGLALGTGTLLFMGARAAVGMLLQWSATS